MCCLIQVWHIDSTVTALGRPLPPLILQHSSFVYAAAVYPGDVDFGPQTVVTADYDGNLRLWDAVSGRLLCMLPKVRVHLKKLNAQKAIIFMY